MPDKIPPLNTTPGDLPLISYPIFRDIIMSPEYEAQCARIGEQFFRSRQANLTPEDFFDIQEKLFHLVFEYQTMQSEGQNENNVVKDLMGKRLIFVIKAVVDSSIWRELGFDKFILHFLTSHNTTGKLNQDSYVELEAARQRMQTNGSKVALCDISNLRYGDIIEFNNGIPEIIDIKAGRGSAKSGRATKQRQENSAINHYFRNGRQRLTMPGTQGRDYIVSAINLLPVMISETRSHLASLDGALGLARNNGYISTRVHDLLGLEAWDIRHQDALSSPRIETVRGMNYEVRHNSVLGAFFETDYQASIVPLGNFPFDDQTCFDLITGKLAYASTLNLDGVMHYYGANGIQITPPQRSSQDIAAYVNDYAQNRTGSRVQAELQKGGFFTYTMSNGGPVTMQFPQNHWGSLAADFISVYTQGMSDNFLLNKATEIFNSGNFQLGTTSPQLRYSNGGEVWK